MMDRYNRIDEIKRIVNKLSNEDIKAKRQINIYILHLNDRYKKENNRKNRNELNSVMESLRKLK